LTNGQYSQGTRGGSDSNGQYNSPLPPNNNGGRRS
jgi:hypothetical protein